MMRKLILLLAIISTQLQAQDTVGVSMGAGYGDKVFYSLKNGVVGTSTNNNWDIAFAVYTTQTASIIINGGFGAALYQYTAGDTSEWATLDTAGLHDLSNYEACFDSEESYEPSAFEFNATGHPNYGWGIYNNISHNVVGVKLFLVKTVAGDFKKVWVKNQKASQNSVTIAVANLDNSNEYTKTISKAVGSKNYLYMNLETESVFDVEPSNQTYDLIFTKYIAALGPGSFYPVTGVVANRNVGIAEMRGMPVGEASLLDANFSDNIAEIGSDWKSFNMTTFTYELDDSLSFFVEDLSGNTHQIWFTGFEGSSTGNIEFVQRQVGFVGIDETSVQKNDFNLYPNPAKNNVMVEIANQAGNATISVYDFTGKMVKNQMVNSPLEVINISNLSSGIYIMSLESEYGISTQKLIVE